MILRLFNGVAEMLALTPVLREWRRRHGGPVRVETDMEELLVGNQDVDEVGETLVCEDKHFDVGLMTWQDFARPVTETYAECVFGDTELASWRPFMESGVKKSDFEADFVAAVCLEGPFVAKKTHTGIMESIKASGYTTFEVSRRIMGSWSAVREAIENADVYVGVDGDVSCVALTTDTPAAVCYSYRSPVYFPPFRKSVPFEAVVPPPATCGLMRVCYPKNRLGEFGKTYGHNCSETGRYVCTEWDFASGVSKALVRLAARSRR